MPYHSYCILLFKQILPRFSSPYHQLWTALFQHMYICWDYVPDSNKKKKMYSGRLLTFPYFSREQSRILVTLGVHTIKPSCKWLLKSVSCCFSEIYSSKYKVSCTSRIGTLNMITIDNMPTEYSKVFEFKLKSFSL